MDVLALAAVDQTNLRRAASWRRGPLATSISGKRANENGVTVWRRTINAIVRRQSHTSEPMRIWREPEFVFKVRDATVAAN